MKLVIDTNIIISALIKDSLTRELIPDKNLELITPAYTLTEITKYREEICKKSGTNDVEFNILILILFKKIKIIDPKIYDKYLNEGKELIKDILDIPFIACALAFNCPIWSDDKHFKKQNRIKIFITKDLIEMCKD
jgi:predicted nucleic acid-binding protein